MAMFNCKYEKIVAIFFTRQHIQRFKLASLIYGIRGMSSLFQTKGYWQSLVLY